MLKAAPESRPLVGSSKNINNSGLLASSTPMVTLLRCSWFNPSPMIPMVAPAMFLISSKSIILSQYSYFSATGTSLGCLSDAENLRASRTVAVGSWISICSANPVARWKDFGKGLPSTRKSPVTTPKLIL